MAKQNEIVIPIYSNDRKGKALYVQEVLSPLMVSLRTGYASASYEIVNDMEIVYLQNSIGENVETINVNHDSLSALTLDVFAAIL